MTKNEYTQRFIDQLIYVHGLGRESATADCEDWPAFGYDSPEAAADACFFYFYGGES